MMINLPHYQILTPIYESANSIVYRAIRSKDKQSVIIKMLQEDYPTPEELTRYRQEYEIICGLNLTGVIKAYSLEKYQNTLVIVLEDFGGESVRYLIAEQHLTIQQFLHLAIQIANSLGQIHAACIIHKDVNPANIVWNPSTNQLKLIDFGISTRLPRENPWFKNPNQLEGTLAYISPEQTGRMNQAMDYRTDLYSLGVTFYELLTNCVPFKSEDSMELVHCHLAKMPTPIGEINPSVPPIIAEMVMKLMAKSVEDRYQSAFGVKADLEKCLENLETLPLQDLHFELAQNDCLGKFQIPQKLYGRDNEIKTLLQTFERVANPASNLPTPISQIELILVAGYSGVGKSALVQEVHKAITEKRGYFASGKFGQYQRNIPYYAISQAFNEFCHYLLTESDDALKQWQNDILATVGTNGQVLIDVIPALELIIGQQPQVATVGYTEAQNRFNLVFQNFMRTICQANHPLVLFIDDWQWADSASLTLLKQLMTETDIQYLLIIGVYRDNEVDASHPFLMTIAEMVQQQCLIQTITLTNLTPQDVNALIADTLLSQPNQVQTLTDLVYEKTQGNAFFTTAFLTTLYEENLLTCDLATQRWQWDVEHIHYKGVTDNVVELMAQKIQLLEPSTQDVLKLAASVGNQFDLDTLAVIYKQTPKQTLDALWQAIVEGFVIPLDDNYKRIGNVAVSFHTTDISETPSAQFRFQHDRIQQAAYSLIPSEQKSIVHWQIGQLLLQSTPEEQREPKIFAMVAQLNNGCEQIQNSSERVKVAELNLIAGKKAKASFAYQPALNYLKFALSLLEENSWQRHYNLTLTLHVEAAEAAYLSGDFEQMASLAKVVLTKANTLLDKVAVYEIKIAAYLAQNRMRDAIKVAQPVLKLLGVSLPKKPKKLHIILSLLQTKFILARKPIEDLSNLPEMTEPNQLAAMRIMSSITSAAYLAMPTLFPLIVLTQVKLSITHGNTAISPYAYASYGLILCGVLGDISKGYQFGQLALTLLDKLNVKQIKCRTVYVVNTFVKHWQAHIKETVTPFTQAYQSGLETGDVEFATYSMMTYFRTLYILGKDLTVIEQEMAKYHDTIHQLKQQSGLHLYGIYRQVIVNLKNPTNNPCLLTGEYYNETIMLPLYLKANNRNAIFHLYFNKLVFCYLFQNYSSAVKNAAIAEKHLDGTIGALYIPLFYFFDSLANLAIMSDNLQTAQKHILKKVAANQKKLKKWAHHAPMNYLHKFYLVAAEHARVLAKHQEAREYYDKAIVLAQQHEYLNDEALCLELAGQFYAVNGQKRFAKVCLRDAHYAYQRWGAAAKVKDLENRYPSFFTQNLSVSSQFQVGWVERSETHQTIKQTTAVWCDFNSVVKASQTLSGEIVLNRLLEKMMMIVIENAGAEQGFLLLPQANNWLIEAESHVNHAEIKVLQSLPLESYELKIAVTIIHYVVHTQENVVLNNAIIEGNFTHDPHIIKQQPKSVLCAPLINQGQLTGILYLENNLTTGAFTKQRVELLNLLSSQMAIAIENARLYANLKTLNQAYERFVPHEFLSLLDKKSIMDVQLGDQIAKEMTILFSDIRGFTSLSEQMTPQENFNFLNSYLSKMEPVIFEYNGFIDKYIGDGIMALFPTCADDAVRSSIALLKKLVDYNQGRKRAGYQPIAIGIGLNTGQLMLGTIGGQNRMDGTVISDAVNLASRIEGMTKRYNAALLISESTYFGLSNVSQYTIRPLDRVKAKGKVEPVTIYEVFDGEAPQIIELKMKTLFYLKNGLAHYRQKEFSQAKQCFQQMLRVYSKDKAAQIYLERCEHFQTYGVPDDWEGVEVLESK